MTVSSCDKPVLYCGCTTREPNIDSISVDPTCNSCQERLPDDKAIYMVLRKHVRDLRYLVGRGSNSKKHQCRMKSRGNRNVMDDIESDPYPEDVQKLHNKYGFEVKLIAMCPGEATWVPEPTPAPERAPSPYDCTPEVDVTPEDDRPTKSDGCAEPDVIEEEYVDVRDDVQEKPCNDDDDDDGDAYTNDKFQEGATKPGDSKEDRDIHHEQESPDKADIYAPYRNRYEDKNGTVSVQLGIQYELMVQLQRYIKIGCYAFGSGELPETLARNGWDCDEAVTLDCWMREFLDRPEIFDVGGSVESPQSLFQRLREIQAVNLGRKRLTSDEIHELLSDACALMDVLNVSGYKEIIKKLESRIGKLLVDFAVRYQSFRQRRDEKLKQVKSERARLDRLERTILAEMEDDMEGSQSMVKREIWIALDKTAAKGNPHPKKNEKSKKRLNTDTPPMAPPPPVKETIWDTEEPVAKASYDDDRHYKPEARTEYDILARDAEPSTACDTPAADAEEETMGKCKAIAEAIPNKTDWDFMTPVAPLADEIPKEDVVWGKEESAAVEVEPTKPYEEPAEEAKPLDEEEHGELKPDGYIQEEQKVANLPFRSPYRLMTFTPRRFRDVQKVWPYGRRDTITCSYSVGNVYE